LRLTAEKHRLKVMFSAADNNRLSRRELMRIGPPRRESALDETRQTGAEKDRKTRLENRSNQTLKTRCGTGKTQSAALT